MQPIFRAILGAVLGFVAVAHANPVTSVVQAIEQHPRVLAAQARVLLSQADAKREQASLFPRVTFATDGGKKIFGSASDTQQRALGDNDFVDGVVTARQQLFDFGATSGRIDAALADASAAEITPALELNALTSEVLEVVAQYRLAQDLAVLAQTTYDGIAQQADMARMRFESGLTNAAEYRRLLLNLERLNQDRERAKAQIETANLQAAERLGLPVDDIAEFYDALDKQISSQSDVWLSLEQIERRRLAVMHRIKSVEAERLPSIALELEGRLFDLDHSIAADYEVTGNLIVSVPFFDGGARSSRQAAAEFEALSLQREAEFNQRVLQERTRQLVVQIGTVSENLANFERQAESILETLRTAELRQGQTEVAVGELAGALMNLYDNQVASTQARSELQRLAIESITLSEQWPARINELKGTL